MSLRFKTNLLEHSKAVSRWAVAHGAKAYIDLATLSMAVQRGRFGAEFTAQFVGHRRDGRLGYFSTLDDACIGFVGWLPYPIQQWPVSASKLAFKELAATLGIRTPTAWLDPAAIDDTFIVKADRSAFGYGIHGPYRVPDARRAGFALRDGEYADAFKTGRIARAWYWAGQLAVLEVFEMPRVSGDGRSSYRQLLQARLASGDTLPTGVEELARAQGLEPDAPVPIGATPIADYRYVSPFNPTAYANHNRLASLSTTRVGRAFIDAGRALWSQLPGARERQFAFVLDAIVDDRDEAWFLEVNSNAQLHPDLYPVMLRSMFGG